MTGDLWAALPLFEDAYVVAIRAGQEFIAADAAHMAALTGDMVEWTERGLELAERSSAARPWAGMLLNKRGSASREIVVGRPCSAGPFVYPIDKRYPIGTAAAVLVAGVEE